VASLSESLLIAATRLAKLEAEVATLAVVALARVIARLAP
jgi:hypothetical protein